MSQKVNSDSDSEPGRLASCWATTCEQWHGFLKFLWNPEEKTVLGRGGKSWGQILIFYACYYAFLAGLFAVAISIVLGTLDPYVPRFQTRIQAPGLSIQPRESSKLALTSDIMFTAGNEGSYSKYVNQMEKFLNAYGNQSNEAMFENCTNGKVMRYQTFNSTEKARACTFFPEKVLGECAVKPYGYNSSQPCILVKVNRIINWFPVGFTNLDKAKGSSDSKAPNLQDVLNVNDKRYDPYRMYIACYGVNDNDQKNLNNETGPSNNTRYFPEDNGIPFMYYPYYGKERQPQYRQPVVAVQFMNVKKNVEIKVGCKAYARNIVDDARMQIGYFNFALKINE